MGLEPPRDVASFVQRWGKQWQEHKSINGSASSSGRYRLISDAQAKACLDVLLNWRQDGLAGPYRSIQALVTSSPVARGILQRSGAGTRTLSRAMKRICPTLSFKKLTIKAKLSERNKEQRVAVCQRHMTVADSTLETVLWIDAKTMYMNITHRYGWVDSSKDDVYETKRTSSSKANIIKLKYYIAVNARLGAVKLVFYTGTTGMPAARDGKTYLVRSTNVQLWGHVGISIMHDSGDGLLPAAPLALVSSYYQPQYTVTSILRCGS